MQFGSGFGGSVIGDLYGSSGPAPIGQAGQPAPTAGPTGATSLVAKAFGVDDESGSPAGNIAALVGAASWAALAFIWWALPR